MPCGAVVSEDEVAVYKKTFRLHIGHQGCNFGVNGKSEDLADWALAAHLLYTSSSANANKAHDIRPTLLHWPTYLDMSKRNFVADFLFDRLQPRSENDKVTM